MEKSQQILLVSSTLSVADPEGSGKHPNECLDVTGTHIGCFRLSDLVSVVSCPQLFLECCEQLTDVSSNYVDKEPCTGLQEPKVEITKLYRKNKVGICLHQTAPPPVESCILRSRRMSWQTPVSSLLLPQQLTRVESHDREILGTPSKNFCNFLLPT